MRNISTLEKDESLWDLIKRYSCWHMKTLRMKYVILIGVLAIFLFICFIIVLYWICTGEAKYPALSETGAYIPGRYFFTIFFGVLGILLFLLAIFLYTSQKQVIQHFSEKEGNLLKCCNLCDLRICNCFSWSFFGIAGLGLSCLGVFPVFEPASSSEVFIQVIHFAGAFVYFSFFLCHMVFQTCIVFHYNRTRYCWNILKIISIGLFLFWWLFVPFVYYLLINIVCPAGIMALYVVGEDIKGQCFVFDYTIHWWLGFCQSMVIFVCLLYGLSLYFESSFMNIKLDFLVSYSSKYMDGVIENKKKRRYMFLDDPECKDTGKIENGVLDENEINGDFVPLVDEKDSEIESDGEVGGTEEVEISVEGNEKKEVEEI